MRQVLLIYIFIGSFFTLSAQDTSVVNEKLSYGVGGFVTVSTETGINDDRPPYGASGDIFVAYQIRPKYYLHSNLGYKRYTYSNLVQKRTVEDIHLKIAAKKSLDQAKEIKLVLGYEPAFVINATNTNLGIGDSIPPNFFTRDLNNRLSHSLYLGFEFQSKQNGSIEIGYTYTLNQGVAQSVNNGLTNTYFDAIPNHFKIGYNFKFNNNTAVPEEILEARQTLQRLTQDTLYFINKGCPEDYSFAQLDSLLSRNYSYSAYRLLKESEIAQVSRQPNVVHFAIIGEHYSSTSDPISLGIYLLDKDLKNTEYPYPYHTTNTKNSEGLSKCFGSLSNTASLIKAFNQRLFKKYEDL